MKKTYTNLVLVLAFIAFGVTASAQNFVIKPGGEVTLLGTSSIHVKGGNQLVIECPTNSGAAGSLIDKTDAAGNVMADGGVVVNRFLSKDEYHMITSPVVDMPFTSVMETENTNIYVLNEAIYTWEHVATPAMEENVGYLTYSNQYKNIAYTGALFSNQDYSYIDASYNIPDGLDATSAGFHMIGNKFPSAIDLDIVLAEATNSNIAGTIYIWNNASYATYSIGAGGLNGGSQYVAAAQGFSYGVLVDLDNSFTVSQEAKVHDHATIFLKKAEKVSINSLKINVIGNGLSSEMKLFFSDLDGVTENYDAAYDALKMFTGNVSIPEFYLITPLNHKIVADFLPAAKMDNYSSSLGFRVMTAGSYTLDIPEFTFDPNFPVILEDTYTGDRVNLSLGTTYTFTSDAGEFSGRFNLLFNPVSIPTSIDNSADGSSIKFYTNKKDLYINLNTSDINNAKVEIYNLIGSKLIEKELHSNQTVLNLKLNTGDYIVKVISGIDTKVSKIFVN